MYSLCIEPYFFLLQTISTKCNPIKILIIQDFISGGKLLGLGFLNFVILIFKNVCAGKSAYKSKIFFTPIPCTYTCLPLDGMVRNYIITIFLCTWIRKIRQFIVSGSILFLPPEERKKHLV